MISRSALSLMDKILGIPRCSCSAGKRCWGLEGLCHISSTNSHNHLKKYRMFLLTTTNKQWAREILVPFLTFHLAYLTYLPATLAIPFHPNSNALRPGQLYLAHIGFKPSITGHHTNLLAHITAELQASWYNWSSNVGSLPHHFHSIGLSSGQPLK